MQRVIDHSIRVFARQHRQPIMSRRRIALHRCFFKWHQDATGRGPLAIRIIGSSSSAARPRFRRLLPPHGLAVAVAAGRRQLVGVRPSQDDKAQAASSCRGPRSLPLSPPCTCLPPGPLSWRPPSLQHSERAPHGEAPHTGWRNQRLCDTDRGPLPCECHYCCSVSASGRGRRA